MRGQNLSNRVARLFQRLASLAASSIPFTPTGTIAATNVQDAIAEVASEASGASVSSSQPTTDQNAVTLTGLSTKRVVMAFAAFTHNDAGSKTYELQARVTGGTWRMIAQLNSAADATSSIYLDATILDFNQASEKAVILSQGTQSVAIDDSDLRNASSSVTHQRLYMSFKEVWDELRIINTTDANTTIEGSTADQRGRLWAVGL